MTPRAWLRCETAWVKKKVCTRASPRARRVCETAWVVRPLPLPQSDGWRSGSRASRKWGRASGVLRAPPPIKVESCWPRGLLSRVGGPTLPAQQCRVYGVRLGFGAVMNELGEPDMHVVLVHGCSTTAASVPRLWASSPPRMRPASLSTRCASARGCEKKIRFQPAGVSRLGHGWHPEIDGLAFL